MLQEIRHLTDYLIIIHDEGMSHIHQQKIPHFGQLGPFHRDLAIIISGDLGKKPGLPRFDAGNDAYFSGNRFQAVGQTLLVRTQRLTRRSHDVPVEKTILHLIGDFTAPIGWRQHHDPAEILYMMILQIVSDEDAPQGVSDKMDPFHLFCLTID
ncbi:MAG: hypothetical protein AB2565_10710 [Candidatus Thiodiazotropha endolucinida]|uniref:hypothetical protein n=1 Tax=Candidatus Thiodiazotropha endolucinida TaxID=1655433 RepID=UPI00083FD3C0|nr:hypothetical protein [Candidatus Thiodiazotropha endolucinida]